MANTSYLEPYRSTFLYSITFNYKKIYHTIKGQCVFNEAGFINFLVQYWGTLIGVKDDTINQKLEFAFRSEKDRDEAIKKGYCIDANPYLNVAFILTEPLLAFRLEDLPLGTVDKPLKDLLCKKLESFGEIKAVDMDKYLNTNLLKGSCTIVINANFSIPKNYKMRDVVIEIDGINLTCRMVEISIYCSYCFGRDHTHQHCEEKNNNDSSFNEGSKSPIDEEEEPFEEYEEDGNDEGLEYKDDESLENKDDEEGLEDKEGLTNKEGEEDLKNEKGLKNEEDLNDKEGLEYEKDEESL